jgi:MFS transporter, UMF1 family
VTMLITAVIYGASACVTFWLLKERALPNPKALQQSGFKASLAQLKNTFNQAKHYKDFMWFLACGVCYQGGVAVAITLAAIYAEQVIGFKPQETMVLIFVLNVAAAVGAFGFGYFQDKVGHKIALSLTLVGWIATCIIAAITTTKSAAMFAPPKQVGEFFGLWTFATRLASIIGPLSYGAITWMTGGNQRIAIMSTSVLFIVGLLLLIPVNVSRGRAAALKAV